MVAMQTGQVANNPYANTMAMGGMAGANAMLELNERFMTPDGKVGHINAGPHGSGRDKAMKLEPGTMVFSDQLRKDGKTFAKLAKPYEDIINDNKKSDLDRKTAKRLLKNLFAEQEAMKPQNTMPYEGGIPEHGWGEIVGGIAKAGKWAWKNKEAIGGVAETIGALAPIGYNIAQGMKPTEKLDPREFYNPYDAQAMSLMADRRMDVNPMMRANEEAYATTAGNIKSAAGSRGQLLGGLGAAQQGYMQANAQTLAAKQNADLGYMGEQAQFMGQMGQQRAATKFGVADLNARNEAAGRNFMGTAMGQLSSYSQARTQDRNMRKAQEMVLPQVLNYLDLLVPGHRKSTQGTSTGTSPMKMGPGMNFLPGGTPYFNMDIFGAGIPMNDTQIG